MSPIYLVYPNFLTFMDKAEKSVGKLSGTVKSGYFTIRLTDPSVERGAYIKVKHEVYGWVLARIEAMRRFLDDFDDEETMAEARTIGYRDGRNIYFPKTPFRPESEVFRADTSLITSVLGLSQSSEGKGIYIGFLEGHSIPVFLDVEKTIGKHVSVLAKTGAGKSYTVAVILEELLKANVAVVVIDPHGEYRTLGEENDEYDLMMKYGVKAHSYADVLTEYAVNTTINEGAKKIALPSTFDLMELAEIMPMKLGDRQQSILYNVLKDLEGRQYTLEELIKSVGEEPNPSAWKVLSGLESLRDSGLFEGNPIDYKGLVQPGKISLINLLGSDPQIQQIVVAKVVKDLFDLRREGAIPPLFFLIEEAHNFCPERGFGDVVSSSILRTAAAEGRKFGFRLCIVSQRPARVDKNVLSQCNTQIILKVTNPNDLRAISQSIEGFTAGMENDIKQLAVGHALIVGESVEQPLIVDVRVRETRHKAGSAVKKPRPQETKPPLERLQRKPRRRRNPFWDWILRLFIREKKPQSKRKAVKQEKSGDKPAEDDVSP
ncbi:DNA double-strand break repair helicase HerA [uncultured archaeon]|nr:DNA double-strand break repair helicase HerA [uncultured archaeon]